MKKSKIKGKCAYCNAEVSKDSRSILDHFKSCEGKSISGNEYKHMIFLIEGKYTPDYWIVIKAKSDISLSVIDRFIKDIWVECCGHLSDFFDGSSKIGKSRKINQVFEKGRKIDYVYNFGSSTELSLYLMEELEDDNEKNIQVMIRNNKVEFQCSCCENKAEVICPYCLYEDGGLLCESCIKKHKCVMDEGEDVLLPLVNSPRAGECGYTGYTEKEVKKYFPKEII